MKWKLTSILTILFATIVFNINAQTLSDYIKTPFVSSVTGAKQVDRIAFLVNEQGKINVYTADGPGYQPVKQTQYNIDDAQEITSLSISADGQKILFVRGGDHGGNSATVPINSASLVEATKVSVHSIDLTTGKVYDYGSGDNPVFFNNDIFYFIRNGQVFEAGYGNEKSPKQLFNVRGRVNAIQWSPDQKQLLFVSARGTHSFIGIFTKGIDRIHWITPAYNSDSSPKWSKDGKRVIFVRRPSGGGPIDSLTVNRFDAWSIMSAEVNDEKATELYAAPKKLSAGFPRISGGVNLDWSHNDYVTFTSYEDGWPHLYRLDIASKKVTQITKGNYEIQSLRIINDGKQALFSANHGTAKEDKDKLQVFIADLQSGKLEQLSKGTVLNFTPSSFANGEKMVWLSSDVQRPGQPLVLETKSGKQTLVGNDFFKGWNFSHFVTPEHVELKAPDGKTYYAQAFKPKNMKGKVPALLYIHGGPRRQMYVGWHNSSYYFYDYILNQYLAQQGFYVLSVNYRSGTGYGYEFQHPENFGILGASEYIDIQAAGEWLRKQSFVDAGKLGLFGGSYGGYLTAMGLAKHSDIFKFGADIHGVHDRQKKYNLENYNPDFEKAAALAWESSPAKFVETWKSPVILIHGDDDQNVNFRQSLLMYQLLTAKGVEVDYLVLPDETHHWQYFENMLKVKNKTAEWLLKQAKLK
jgi:dipeptidyl aminopeptidase/acylaminoacyl peptidase